MPPFPAFKPLIGTHDRVDLPDLGLLAVAAKIDTGAELSALHCPRLEVQQVGAQQLLAFWLADSQGNPVRELRTDRFRQCEVRNSFGTAETRYVIETSIVLFGCRFAVEVGLADRSRLKFPLLLGCDLLRNRFVVDVAQHDVSYQAKLAAEAAG